MPAAVAKPADQTEVQAQPVMVLEESQLNKRLRERSKISAETIAPAFQLTRAMEFPLVPGAKKKDGTPASIADVNAELYYCYLSREDLFENSNFANYAPVTRDNEGGINVPESAYGASLYVERGGMYLCWTTKEHALAQKNAFRNIVKNQLLSTAAAIERGGQVKHTLEPA